MFVRAVWRQQRLIDVGRKGPEIGRVSKRFAGVLGIAPPDFPKMTRALFDRQG
jgi:hypothetical protein